ncbi:MAG: hypothetical protein ACLFST_09970 [Spirochaetia bacterium]
MISKCRKVLPVLLLLFAIQFPAEANESDSVILSPRNYALGGLHAAETVGLTTLFANPAGLYSAESGFTFSSLVIKAKGPVFSIASVALEAAGGDAASILSSSSFRNLLQGLYTGIQIDGPIAFGYIGDGLGFALLNTTDTEITGSTVTGVEAVISERFVLSGGYAFHIPVADSPETAFDVGFTLKSFLKGSVTISTTLLGLPTFINNISLDTLLASPFEFSAGIGVDAGILFSLNHILKAGLVCRDLFVPSVIKEYTGVSAFIENEEPASAPTYPYLPPNLVFGLQYSPNLGVLDRYISDLKLMLDYRDILDFLTHPATTRNFLLKFGFGAEVTLLDILKLRGGFSEGLFAAGFGIDLSFITVNAAMYGTERSMEPGLKPVFNVALGFDLTF